jgi:hypothetical protein
MGLRYTAYRLGYEVRRKLGVLEKQFSTDTPSLKFISLSDWRSLELPFFFNRKSELSIEQELSEDLKDRVAKMKKGIFRFFSAQDVNVGLNYDWVTNPDTGYTYDTSVHWSKIETLSNAGDIKYVWEKSRFCYLYDLIKYDRATGESQAEFIFSELDSWILANPENCGPNYVCSQEISIRLLNWTFALMYYRDAKELTEARFQSYSNAIYKQVLHVEQNINFSRICVRNNHAITECFMLYFSGVMFPYYPDSKRRKKKGQRLLEEEVDFQFFTDGGYIQYSHNYHRVALQVMTWALCIGKKAGTSWSDRLHSKLGKSLTQLNSMMDNKSGHLPNYGNNDGALFFQLSDSDFRDYRPQLNALAFALKSGVYYNNETALGDTKWYANSTDLSLISFTTSNKFTESGLYILRDEDLKVIVKCTTHRFRPAQADNLHIDVWFKGENVLLDGGSYKYNTADAELNYFMGTASHNTVMLGTHNQMKKASRFIWNYWTKAKNVSFIESEKSIVFEGTIQAFKELGTSISHTRKVTLYKGKNGIEIVDTVKHKPNNIVMKQRWNTANKEKLVLTSKVQVLLEEGGHSPMYGQKEITESYVCTTQDDKIETQITFK